MSDHDQEEFIPGPEDHAEPTASPNAGSGGSAESVMDRLRKKREAIGSNNVHFMDIPGYDGELVAEFKRMRWEALADIAESAEAGHTKRKALNGHADVIATACSQLLIRRTLPGGEEELTPMNELFSEQFGSTPVRFDPRLTEFLELRIEGTPTARKVVFGVFNNDLAVTAFHNELGAWMQSSRSEEEEAFTTS